MAERRITGPVNSPGRGADQATQAALEAETNENTYAPPDLIKHSPGVPKFWCKFNGTSAGPITPDADHNVVDVTDNGTGDYTVNISVDFSTANWSPYAICIAELDDLQGARFVDLHTTSPVAAGTLRIRCIRNATGSGANAFEDPTIVSVGGLGDQ